MTSQKRFVFSIVLLKGMIHYRKQRILLHFNNDLRSYMWICKPVSFLACFNDLSSLLQIDWPNSPWLAHQNKSSDLKYHCVSAHPRKAASISMVPCPCRSLSFPCAVFSWLFRLFIIISSFLFLWNKETHSTGMIVYYFHILAKQKSGMSNLMGYLFSRIHSRLSQI